MGSHTLTIGTFCLEALELKASLSLLENLTIKLKEMGDSDLEEIEKDNLHLARQMTHDIIPKPPSPYLYGEDEQISTWVDWQFERLVITKGVDWFPVGNEAEVHATRNVEVDDIIVPIHMRGFIDRIFEYLS